MESQPRPIKPADTAPVILIGGPTASGKTGLATALAEQTGGVIINADSMQIYKELRVLTARPDAATEARAPHRLFGAVPVRERYSAGRWAAAAAVEITQARTTGHVPILVGGAGLYLRALTEGMVHLPAVPETVRTTTIALHGRIGGDAFHTALARRDPETAQRLAPGDSQRLIRAWEVLEATGRSISDWRRETPAAPTTGPFFWVVLAPPRPALYAACDARFLDMLQQGALEEARRLAALHLDPAAPVMKALGLRPLIQHQKGDLAKDEAIRRSQRDTRRYAKRQSTWFRHQVAADLRLEAQLSDQTTAGWVQKIRKQALT